MAVGKKNVRDDLPRMRCPPIGDFSVRGIWLPAQTWGASVGGTLRGLSDARDNCMYAKSLDRKWQEMRKSGDPGADEMYEKAVKRFDSVDRQLNVVLPWCSTALVYHRFCTGRGALYDDPDIIEMVCKGDDEALHRIGSDIFDTLETRGRIKDVAQCVRMLNAKNYNGKFCRGVIDRDDIERVSKSILMRSLRMDTVKFIARGEVERARDYLKQDCDCVRDELHETMGVLSLDAVKRVTAEARAYGEYLTKSLEKSSPAVESPSGRDSVSSGVERTAESASTRGPSERGEAGVERC